VVTVRVVAGPAPAAFNGVTVGYVLIRRLDPRSKR
jgi:hypothetical protein